MGSLEGTITVAEPALSELRRAAFASSSGTSVPSENNLAEFELVIECERPSPESAFMRLSSPIAVYGGGDWSISGRDYASRDIPYHVLGENVEIEIGT
jgi:hypothetical protein